MHSVRAGFAAAVVGASLMVPAVAVAAPTVSVAPTAQLSPEGASVLVPVTLTCDPGTQASISVGVAQSSAKRLLRATGSSGIPPSGSLITCDGTAQVVPIRATVSGDAPMKPGKAEVTATVFQSTAVPPFQQLTATAGPQALSLKK